MSGPINTNAWTGLNALPVNFRPPSVLFEQRDPTINDWQNQLLMNLWLNTTTRDVWVLVALNKVSAFVTRATWVKISTGGLGNLESLTGNTGGAIFPTGNNINVIGDGTTITVAGNPGTSTLTISALGDVPDSFVTNSGTATPSGGVLNVLGANLITTTGSGNTVTAKMTNGTNGQVPIGGGSNPLWANLTSSGGTITITNGANSINLEAAGAAAQGPAFEATSASNTPNVTGDFTPFIPQYTTALYNIGGGYNTGTGVFTAPISGIYHFDAYDQFTNIGAGHTLGYISFSKNGGSGFFGTSLSPAAIKDSNNNMTIGISTDINLNAGDTVNVLINVANSTKTVGSGSMGGGYFCGYYISAQVGTTATAYDTDSGVATPSGGVLNINGDGNGFITTSGSSNTVTLNTPHYATGTFLPVLSFGGASTGITYVVQAGKYERIGNIVYFSLGIALSSKGSSTGNMLVSGLPVASASPDISPCTVNWQLITLGAGYTYVGARVPPTTTTMVLEEQGSGLGQTILQDTNFANNSQFSVSGFYFLV